ncbi:Pre-mRNA-splicing factor SPF27 [Rhodotorula diobovata]|uniref:Pre-mRNA-splicing factor SPF27 n=1 Tax=Rhodotorula diobovata TaxID=5288 RepID=A0A5C5FKN6_9BASI|nr:Pre-mRNA-splicing factor SPF27 [Rhodotorula diobovata]
MADTRIDQPLDSLPYYDRDADLHPELRPAINSQIAVELRSLLPKSSSANPSNLSHLPPPRPLPSASTHPLLASELARVESKRPLRPDEGLDTTRYAMPFPPEQDQDSVAAWEAAHRSSLAQLEHQRLRSLNGTLLQQLGGNKWRVDNFALENAIQRVEKEGEGVKEEVDEVNRRRKADQEKAGETLSRLEKRWTELVSSGVQLEIGSVALEEQLVELRARHADLQRRVAAVSQ